MVDRVDVSSVLMQMRQVKDQLRSQNEMASEVRPNTEMDAVRISKQADSISVNEISGDNTILIFSRCLKMPSIT